MYSRCTLLESLRMKLREQNLVLSHIYATIVTHETVTPMFHVIRPITVSLNTRHHVALFQNPEFHSLLSIERTFHILM